MKPLVCGIAFFFEVDTLLLHNVCTYYFYVLSFFWRQWNVSFNDVVGALGQRTDEIGGGVGDDGLA